MVPNMEATESNQQDEIDGWFDEVTKRSGYLEIRGTKFEQYQEREMAIAVEAENPEKKPAFLQKTRFAFKLIWPTEEERNKAVEEGIKVEGITLIVQKPIRETGVRPPRVRTLYLHGIPIAAPASFVEEWVQKVFSVKIKPTTNVQFTKYAGTSISSATRSVVVIAEVGQELPGFQMMEIPGTKRGIQIRVAYHGSPIWCKQCVGKGHIAIDCPQNVTASVITNEGYPKLTGHLGDIEKSVISEDHDERGDEMIERLTKEYGTKFFGCEETDQLGECQPARFEIEGKKYESVVHYVVAKHPNNSEETAKEI